MDPFGLCGGVGEDMDGVSSRGVGHRWDSWSAKSGLSGGVVEFERDLSEGCGLGKAAGGSGTNVEGWESNAGDIFMVGVDGRFRWDVKSLGSLSIFPALSIPLRLRM
jgi:hypothetical protein